MKKILLLTLSACFLQTTAFAQTSEKVDALYDAEGELIPGEGPKGRYTREQVIPFALKLVPGELVDQGSRWTEDDFYHEYDIQTEDGSIYQLEYLAQFGRLHEIEVEKLSDDPWLPPGVIEKEKAEKIALLYGNKKIHGALEPKIQNIDIDVLNRSMVYVVEIRKGTKRYEIYIDAFQGLILKEEQL